MNPDLTIRPWLLECASQGNFGEGFGAFNAYEYRLADDDARPEHLYFTYRITSMLPDPSQEAVIQENTEVSGSSYDAYRAAKQHWIVTAEIDYYNSQNGLEELAACCIAARDDTGIADTLGTNNAEFRRVVSLINKTNFENDDRVYYHYTLVVEFTTWARYSHKKINERIISVDTDDAFSMT